MEETEKITIVLYPPEEDTLIFEQLKKDIQKITTSKIYYTYKNQNQNQNQGLFLKIIRKILTSIFKWEEKFLYAEWKNIKVETVENIIIFDSSLGPRLLEYLTRKYKTSRLIFWYRNPIPSLKQIEKVKKYCNQVLTFDEEESIKYKIDYIGQFYYNPSNLFIESNIMKEKYDIYFIGLDKNRINDLEKISEYFKEKEIKQKIQVLKDKKKKYKKYEKIELIEKSLRYSEILENVFLSKCILEICQNGQKGLTFRTMEALFFNKKLISNNKNLKKYEFYNENNIYILNEEKRTIEEFFDEPFVEINEKIKEKYLFENWLKKIVKKEDF